MRGDSRIFVNLSSTWLMMNIHVYRFLALPDRTLGFFMVNSVFMGYTLEDCHRKPGVKVKAETCIPAGSYNVVMHLWSKHNTWKPKLEAVPGFEGILIHGGVKPTDSEGCLLVGRILTPANELNSSLTDAVTAQVQAAINAKQKVTCHVVNCPDLATF